MTLPAPGLWLLFADLPTAQSAAKAAPGMGWIFWAVLTLLLVVILALIILLVWQHKRAGTAPAADAKDPAPEHASHAELASVFKAALAIQGSMVSGRKNFRYKLPWFALLGATNSGKSSLFMGSSLAGAVEQRTGASTGDPLIWNFTTSGAVVEIGGWALNETQPVGRTWKELLRQFVNTRPQRPLDGLILTIAAADLWGPKALLPAQLAARGALLQQRLRQMTKAVGFQLPIFVLLTRCDELEGFQAFAGELDAKELDQIFGWSNPYSNNIAFQSDWVDEAVSTMRLTIERAQSRLFATNEPGIARESMFVLPGSLHATLAPLRALLSRALRSGGELPAPFLRGVYCTGSVTAGAAPAVAEPELVPAGMPQGASYDSFGAISFAPKYEEETIPDVAPVNAFALAGGGPQVGFVHDVFLQKIFPERNLGRPLDQLFRVRDRTRLYLQLACACLALLLTVGTGLAYRRMAADSRALQGVLNQIAAAKTNSRESYAADPNEADLHPGAMELVAIISSFRSGKFHSVLLPASLFSAVPERVSRVVENAFGQLVLARFSQGLTARAGWLAGIDHPPLPASQLPPAPPASTPVTDVRQTAEYLELQAFLSQVAALDNAMALYNQMCHVHSNAPLSSVVRLDGYLHNRSEAVPEDIDGVPYFQMALDNAHYPCFADYPQKQGISGHAEALITNLDAAWIAHNPVRRITETLKGDIDSLNTASTVDPATLTRVSDDFRRAQLVYSNPSLHWTGVSPLAAPPDVAAVTTGIVDNSPFFVPELASRVSVLADTNLSQLLSALSSTESSVTGPIVDTSTGQLALSPAAQELQAALDALSKASFVAAGGAPSISLESARPASAAWDKASLDAAAGVPPVYGKYMSEALGKARAPIRLLAGRLAAAAAADSVDEDVLQAEHTSVGTDAVADARSFADAAPSLTTLLGVLTQYKLNAPMQELRRVADLQAAGVLGELSATLVQQQPYGLGSAAFVHWESGLPSAKLFNASTSDALAAYLAAQQDEVSTLNTVAGPAVQFLEANRAFLTPPMVRSLSFWQGIGGAVEAYTGKKPGNTIQGLQDLISKGADAVLPANGCPAPRLTFAAQHDYFSQAALQLQRGLVARCHELLNRDFDSAYTELAGNFNQGLAERFPFGPLSSLPLSEADPTLISRVYGVYDTASDLLLSPRLNSAPQPVQNFVHQLAGGRPWFAPLLSPSSNGGLTFGVTPAFRVNRAQEVNGDQIIAWALQLGDTTLHNGDQLAKLVWNLSDPVIITLRWAKNSPLLPAKAFPPSQIAGELRSDGETVTWKFTDTWALLRCLRTLEQDDPERRGLKTPGEESFLLRMEIPLVQASTGSAHAQSPAPALAKVFIRLLVSAPGQKEVLPPPLFPAVAPPLTLSPTQASSGDLQ